MAQLESRQSFAAREATLAAAEFIGAQPESGVAVRNSEAVSKSSEQAEIRAGMNDGTN